MKLCRYFYNGQITYGVYNDGHIYKIAENDIFGEITKTDEIISIDNNDIQILCPTDPKNIFAIGLNYKDHANELDMKLPDAPLIFIKATSSLTANNTDIIQPVQTEELSCEAELAIVVKKTCKNVAVEDAADYILGYSMINDVTARDIQRIESQWARAKSFDTFCPYGPWIETDIDSVGDKIQLYVDGKVTQDGKISDMIFSPQYILSYVSSQFTLHAGDIIATGTPKGVSTIYPGQKVEVAIENLGILSNVVVGGHR